VFVLLVAPSAVWAGEIHEAVRVVNFGRVKALLEATPDLLSARDEYDQTPLHEAARGGYEDIVKLLLDKGAHLDLKDNLVRTPVYNAHVRHSAAVRAA